MEASIVGMLYMNYDPNSTTIVVLSVCNMYLHTNRTYSHVNIVLLAGNQMLYSTLVIKCSNIK